MSTYDAVPYTSLPYPRTHPDHQHAMARIFGVRAAPVEDCRVLEIGCGSAGNLLAIAASLPRATCVGLDASPGEIWRGRELARAAAIENVDLQVARVGDDELATGSFDYVVAHGILSWVPPRTRAALLQLVGAALSPNGVAYASYNVHPGWHLRGAVRGMLAHHLSEVSDPRAKIDEARTFLRWLSTRMDRTGAMRSVLDEELERLAAADDSYLFHELLEEENHPLWFHELAAEASAHGLRWLGEAEPGATIRMRASPRAHAALAAVAGEDPIRIEQHFDFLRGRSFRASLFVRAEHQRREAPGEELVDLFVASNGAQDLSLAIDDAEVNGALATLAAAWPDAVPAADLSPAPGALLDRLAALHATGAVELRARRLGLAQANVLRPVATALARVQATRPGAVTNLRHEPIDLAEPERQVLARLDGTRTRDAFDGAALASIETLARFAFLRDAE